MNAAFFAALRPQFGGQITQAQVDGLNRLLAATDGLPISDRAYILATTQHETGGTMQPVREAFGRSDADTVNKLDKAWEAGRLPQVSIPYWRFDQSGRAWFGRGYVQLTHEKNYAKAGQRIGVDLIADPKRALNPEVAALILVRGMREGWFTGKKLSDFLPGDYVNARKVVNGTDRAHAVARLAEGYEAALRVLGPATAAEPTGTVARLWAALLRVYAFIVTHKHQPKGK